MPTAKHAVHLNRQQLWESRTEWPLAGIALVFLAIYSVQIVLQPPQPVSFLLNVFSAVLYLAFVVDYAVRLTLADQRRRWFVRHLLDLAVVALPFLRPLRLLRLVVVFQVMQRAFGAAIRGRVVAYTACSAVLLIYVASLGVLQAERSNPQSDINTFGKAVWWAITTVTTVGYGDLSPITTMGRFIAVLLMIGGISLIGVVTATLASWIVERVAEEDLENQAATRAQINELRVELRHLRAALSHTTGTANRPRLPVASFSQAEPRR